MKRSTCIFSLLLVLLSRSVAAAPIDGFTKPVDLFVRVDPPEVEPMPQYRALWSIEVNEEAIRQPAQAIRLNGPDFPDIDVPLLRWSPRAGYIEIYNDENPDHPIIIPNPDAEPEDFSWYWYGKVGHVTVSLLVERGVLAGYIWLRDRRFALRPSAAGLLLGETRSEYWRTHPDDGQEGEVEASIFLSPTDAPMPGASLAGGWDFSCQGAPPTGQHVIDVLVLYTPAVLLEYNNHAGVEAQMQLATTAANTALRNSGINSITYSLRGVEFLPDSGEYDTSGIAAGLIELSGWESLSAPPYCSLTPNTYVRGRRDTMWADVIALARRDQSGEGSCGLTFIQRGTTQGCIYEPGAGFSDYAYMIFDPECGADRLNFAHELGHQLGVEHDPRNSPSLTSSGVQSCPWSFAHRLSDSVHGFRTVMAYPGAGTTGIPGPACSSDGDCPLIDAFSTPTLEWTGAGGVQPVGTVPGSPPIGVGSPPPSGWQQARATDTLLRLAPVTAAFRARPDSIFSHGFEF